MAQQQAHVRAYRAFRASDPRVDVLDDLIARSVKREDYLRVMLRMMERNIRRQQRQARRLEMMLDNPDWSR